MSKSVGAPVAVPEIERKYTASGAQDLPALGHLTGVAGEPVHDSIQLSATYFDTADYRLLAEKITLRKREGGDDAGWHLKLPQGQDTRTEFQVPPDGGTDVPAQLSSLIRAIVRGSDLVPIALIITDRERTRLYDDDGALLAEVVADTVIACRADGSGESTWQEVEVEQAAGGRELADAIETVLIGAGLTRSASPSKLVQALGSSVTPFQRPRPITRNTSNPRILLRNYLVEQLATLISADLGTRRGNAEAVHDFRVAARRLRSAVTSYASTSATTEGLVADLRWIAGKFGDARDVDVQWTRIVKLLVDIDDMPERETVRARVDEYFSARADVATDTALRALESERYTALLDHLDEYIRALDDSAETPRRSAKAAAGELSRTLRHLAHRVGKRVDRVSQADSRAQRDERMHRARKGAKRMRYAIEVMQPAARRRTARALKHFENFQDVLGEHQDSAVAQHHLLAMAAEQEHSSLSSFGLGMAYRRECEITDRQATLLERSWKEAVKSASPLW